MDFKDIIGFLFFGFIAGGVFFLYYILLLWVPRVKEQYRAEKKARKKEKKRLKKLALANSQTESPSA